MRRAILVAVGLALALLTGCHTPLNALHRPDAGYRFFTHLKTGVIPPTGLIYTDIHAPIAPLDTTPAIDLGSVKKGTATTHSIGLPPFLGLLVGAPIPALGLFSWGNGSERAAAVNGGITQVTHTDYKYRIILFIYQSYTTEVYGH